MKTIRPMLLMDGDAVHYLWPVTDPFEESIRARAATLCDLARSVASLGWGIDMAIGHGAMLTEAEAKTLQGERWFPTAGSTDGSLRVPRKGTLDSLEGRHRGFLNRLSTGSFTPPPPLTAYEMVMYRRASDADQNPVAAFALRKPDGTDGFRAFDTPRQALTVAGMLRYTAKLTAKRAGWTEDHISKRILGHGEARGGEHVTLGANRLAYLPLPTIEFRGEGRAAVAGSVRRVLLTTFAGSCENEIAWSRRAMSGQLLIDENTNQPTAVLSAMPLTDAVIQMYLRRSTTWATVTPVVLPGYDDPAHYRRRLKHGVEAEEQRNLLDKLYSRTDALFRKAVTQAGFSEELADHAKVEWRKVGFWAGTELAERYGVPKHLKRFPRFHVRIQWRDAQNKPVSIPGPICLGGGRFYGLGLLAAAE
jgi:CRISPR-associated protein Csb2